MKEQILLSPEGDKGSGNGETVRRLAERYGIPERDVEALLYGSRAPKSEAMGSDMKEKSMAEDFRPGYRGMSPQRDTGWSPLNVLSAILGILGIVAIIAMVMMFAMRNRREDFEGNRIPGTSTPMMATKPNSVGIKDSACCTPKKEAAAMNTVPDDDSMQGMSEETSNPKPSPKKHKAAHHHSASGFTTPNSIEAQEHLAEMRAEGNSKARIRQSTKNGITVYSVK